MKTSIAVLSLIGLAAAQKGFKVKSLAEASSERGVDATSYWKAGTEGTELTDDFKNTFTQQVNGDFMYEDEHGVSWYFDDSTSIWTG